MNRMVEPALKLEPAKERELHIHKSAPEWAKGVVTKLGSQFNIKEEWKDVKGQRALILMGDTEALNICPFMSVSLAQQVRQLVWKPPHS